MAHFPALRTTSLAALLAAASLALVLPLESAQAQASAPSAASDTREALVQRLLALWHVENVAVMMVQRPAANAMEQSRVVLQSRVSAEKRDRTLKDIAVDVQHYVDEATPIAAENAKKLLAPTLTPLLLKNFNDEELRQVIALLESPVKKKFEALVPELERALGEKVAEASGAAINPKLETMTKTVATKLRAATMAP